MDRRTKGILFCFVGASALLGSIISGSYRWRFVSTAERAEGKVVQMEELKMKHGVYYAPVFVFPDGQGEMRTVHSSAGRNPPQYHVGDRVAVLYPLRSPGDARLDDFFSIWGLTTVLGVLGLAHLVGGLVITFFPKLGTVT